MRWEKPSHKSSKAYKAAQSEGEAAEEQPVRKRHDQMPQEELLHACLMAYAIYKMPLRTKRFSTITWLCKNTGAAMFEKQYAEHYFATQYLTAMTTVFWEQAIHVFKSNQQIGLYIDVADGHLLIRISGLDSNNKLKTIFWQARHMATKNSHSLQGFDQCLHHKTA